jgi:RecJ-like exonuclease
MIYTDCPVCNGTGVLREQPDLVVCPNCEGTGAVAHDELDDPSEPDSDITLGLTDRYMGGSGGY